MTAPRRYRHMEVQLGGTAGADQIYAMVLAGRSVAEIAAVCSTSPGVVAAALVAPLPDPPMPINWVSNNTAAASAMYGGSIPAFTAQARIAYPFPRGGYTWGTPLYAQTE